MNDATQGSEVKKAIRTRVFGRVYDYDKGTVTITVAYDPTFKKVVSLDAVPPEVLKSFALQSVADYVVQQMNDTLKDETDSKDETTRQLAALEVVDEAFDEVVKGQVDFREGNGLGGVGEARSAIGNLGNAVFELGKTFFMVPSGDTRTEPDKPAGEITWTKLTFADAPAARAAAKVLYTSTKAYGDKKLTGRMMFNVIQQDESVKAKLAEKVKAAKPKVDLNSLMG